MQTLHAYIYQLKELVDEKEASSINYILSILYCNL